LNKDGCNLKLQEVAVSTVVQQVANAGFCGRAVDWSRLLREANVSHPELLAAQAVIADLVLARRKLSNPAPITKKVRVELPLGPYVVSVFEVLSPDVFAASSSHVSVFRDGLPNTAVPSKQLREAFGTQLRM
jgi:hypothetical protein